MTRYRARPVEVGAIMWEGGDTTVLDEFAGNPMWTRADVHDIPWGFPDGEGIVVWCQPIREWLPLPVGYWLVRGVRGELIPCAPEVFSATYEAVEGPQ